MRLSQENVPMFKNPWVPVPPVPEQEETVRRTDSLLALAERLQARYGTAAAYVDKLTQSVFANAFCGEPLPTEEELARREGREFEGAGELIERIRRTQPGTLKARRSTKSLTRSAGGRRSR